MESTDDKYIKAKERVAELKKFYNSLTTFIVINLIFILINYMTNGFEYAWFWWVTIWWGVGVAFHGLKVFGLHLIFSKDWEQRKIRQFMEKNDGTYSKETGHKWE